MLDFFAGRRFNFIDQMNATSFVALWAYIGPWAIISAVLLSVVSVWAERANGQFA